MDVLGILQNSGNDLLPDELEMLCAELDTGDYAADYTESCKKLISELRNWSRAAQTTQPSSKSFPDALILSPDALVPEHAGIPTPPPIPPEKVVSSDLQRMRTEKDYKTAFKNDVKASTIIDEAFIVSHFAMFKDWERNAMLACIQFSESYLEQYFSVLDTKMIALYQLFSESFFMKHYAELVAETVLTKGVNPWREKGQRSRQLDVFLRIKGVKL